MESYWREKASELDRLICVRGRLTSPTTLLTEDGEYDVQKETFYPIGEVRVFQLRIDCFPWLITKAIRIDE